jgi:hypothetical protein
MGREVQRVAIRVPDREIKTAWIEQVAIIIPRSRVDKFLPLVHQVIVHLGKVAGMTAKRAYLMS